MQILAAVAALAVTAGATSNVSAQEKAAQDCPYSGSIMGHCMTSPHGMMGTEGMGAGMGAPGMHQRIMGASGMGPGMMGAYVSAQRTEDIKAFTDARIAALKAGLVLTSDQEKIWPPFEQAVRDLVKLRLQRIQAREASEQQPSVNPFDRLQHRAEAMSQFSAALKHVAETGAPLYEILSDAQKYRFRFLAHLLRLRWMGEGRGGPYGMIGREWNESGQYGMMGPMMGRNSDNRGPYGMMGREWNESGPYGMMGPYREYGGPHETTSPDGDQGPDNP
jgi:hypothetical protein